MRFVIFIGPQACVGLHSVLDRNGTLPVYATSIHVLVHESFHQRDGIYANALPRDAYFNSYEGRTDCAALAADEAAGIGLFGFPATVQSTYTEFQERPAYKWVYRYVWKRTHAKRVKKRIRAATYPAYAGDCAAPVGFVNSIRLQIRQIYAGTEFVHPHNQLHSARRRIAR